LHFGGGKDLLSRPEFYRPLLPCGGFGKAVLESANAQQGFVKPPARLAFKKAANPEKSFETKLKSHHSAKVSRDSTVCSNSGSSTGP